MKFFKHFVDGHSSTSMTKLMNQFGLEGYAAYFILIEMCVAKMEKHVDEVITEDHCRFRFSERLVREKFRMRSTKVELLLNYSSTLNLLQFTKVEDELHFYVPKLLECLDRDSRRARHVRGNVAAEARLDREEDKDRDIEAQKKRTTRTNRVSGAIPVFAEHADWLEKVSHEVQNNWLKLYPDPTWINREILKAKNWLLANPRQSRKDKGRFLSNWFENANDKPKTTAAKTETTWWS